MEERRRGKHRLRRTNGGATTGVGLAKTACVVGQYKRILQSRDIRITPHDKNHFENVSILAPFCRTFTGGFPGVGGPGVYYDHLYLISLIRAFDSYTFYDMALHIVALRR